MMHSPGANDPMFRPRAPHATFTFGRLAHALWPSMFPRTSSGGMTPSSSTASPVPPALREGRSKRETSQAFGGVVSTSGLEAPSSLHHRGGNHNGGAKASSHQRRTSDDVDARLSLSPDAIARTMASERRRERWHRLLRRLGKHGYKLWVAIMWVWLFCVGWVQWLFGRRASSQSYSHRPRRRHGGGHHGGAADDDDEEYGRPRHKRQLSEVSLSDDSPTGTPTGIIRGLVVPPQGDRMGGKSRKRRNVYYDVEEASYRPMHRLLFMRERSINPVSQKKFEAASAAAAGGGNSSVGGSIGRERSAGGFHSSDDMITQITHARQYSIEGASSSIGGPSSGGGGGLTIMTNVPMVGNDEYTLNIAGDSAQIMLSSPIATLGPRQKGGGEDGEETAGEGGAENGADPSTAAGGADGTQPTDPNEPQPLSAAEGGYFGGKYGDKVCDGTFILVSQLGSGAFSTVWLAIDVKGATSAIGPGLMFRNRMDDTRYNATAAVMKQGFAFVVLKISRSALPYRQACEKEFETHQQLYLRLQREGFDVSKFLLFPLSMLEQVPRGPCHSVQVGAACGPSLLSFVLHAAPSALASLDDKLWRMRFIRQFMRNTIEGLGQLHSCGILHTDVKPENILLTLPAYEVLRKMKAEPLLRDAKGRMYRASGRGGGSVAATATAGGSDSSTTKGGPASPNAPEGGGSTTRSDAGAASMTLTGLTAEEEDADKDLIFAKHRLEIFNGIDTWTTLRGRHTALYATEEMDVVEALGAIKVADLGNAVFVSNVRLAELQLKATHSVSERNELLLATSATHSPYGSIQDPAAMQQTAQYFQAAAAAHAFQTREYRAPEIIVGVQPLTRMLTPAMDVWSIGCLIFELVTGSYLFNPHAAVQQEVANGGVPPVDTEFRHNEVHLSMMQEICSTMPLRGANGSGSEGGPGTPGPAIGVSDVIRKQGRMSEALFRNMLPIAPDGMNGEPLLQAILEQRTFCDVDRKGADASFRNELAKVAQMLGAIFRWDPLERPSMNDLLAMPWLRDDGCS